ncbi:MAG TPA: hypothetical protein VGI39_46485 [Polyangiaceae bacterium]|jgi:hypothetical protein
MSSESEGTKSRAADQGYGAIYRHDYDATYGSPRQIGISGVRARSVWEEEDPERKARDDARARAERAVQELLAVDATRE